MSEEQLLGKLFVKYQKLNVERGEGVGLLMMVKKLVDHFDSEIKVKSELSRGTEIQDVLPFLPSDKGAM